MTSINLQEYHLPRDGSEVAELLSKHGEGATVVAGGTFIHGLVARGLITQVEAFIDLSKLGWNDIRLETDSITIGATTTFRELAAYPQTSSMPVLGAIQDALHYPPPQVMNSATIGGCVAASCPFFDMPVALLALDVMVTAMGKGHTRNIPLDEFLVGLFENSMEATEVVRELIVPLTAGHSVSAFIKLETNANDLAILNVAVMLTMNGSGECNRARVFVGGGVGEVPFRSRAAERMLMGGAITAETCQAAGQAARTEIEPLGDHRASAEYRKHMSGVLVERALLKAMQRVGN